MSAKSFAMSAAEFDALVEQRRSEQFLFACSQPGVWLDRALQHKRAADILFEVAHSAYTREVVRNREAWAEGAPPNSVSRRLVGQELEDFQDQRLLAEYLLLVGYALECVLKGYLLSILPELVVDDKRIDKLVANHNLVQLCHDCAVSLSLDEMSLLQLVTRHVVWGKYAAPLTRGSMPS